MLALMKEIRASTVSVKKIVDNHGSSWSKLRGELFDLLTSVRELLDLVGYLPELEEDTERSVAGKEPLKVQAMHWASSLEELAKQNIDPKYFEFPYDVELSIMGICSRITGTIDFYIPVVERLMNKSYGSSLTLVQDFVSSYGDYFNGNWTIAVVHLSAMEVIINRKREQFGLLKPDADVSGESFQKSYAELRNYLLEKNIDIESEVHSKADVLLSIRNRVMHHGMKLDDESLALVIKWSRAVIDALSETQ